MHIKRCFKCNEVKPLGEFYVHSRMTDGHLNKCKTCTKKNVKTNYAERRPHYIAYEQERSKRPERRQAALSYQTNSRKDHPDKHKARQMIGNTLRDGRLTRKPCEVCQTTMDVQAHHDDYSKPLEVRWLCFQHHREVHGQTTVKAGTG